MGGVRAGSIISGLVEGQLVVEGCGRADLLLSRWQGSRKQSVRTWLKVSIAFKVTLPSDLLPQLGPSPIYEL